MGKTTKKDIFKDREAYIKIEAKTGGRCSESMFRKYLVKICGISLLMAGLISGCSIEQTNETKVSDLTYTIVEESETPEELKTMIEEKKTADFKLTYEMEDDLYIVRGYGEQATGGYSICVRDCYLTTNAVVFDTELIGPRKGEVTNASPSCPYIVIQVKNEDKSIIFE